MKIPFKEKIREKSSHFLSMSNFSKLNQDVLLNHFDYYGKLQSKERKSCLYLHNRRL